MTRGTEGAVLAALRSGDEAAFDAFVRAQHPELLRFAIARARDRSSAEEAVQETWLVFLERLETFEARSSLRTFLFGILINVLRARGRRDRRAIPLSSLGDEELVEPDRFVPADQPWAGHWSRPPSPWPSGEDALHARELRDAIAHAIEALPDPHREVLTLRDGLGWEAAEIAALLETSEGNVRVVLHRARCRVRSALEKRFAGGL